MEKDLFDDLMDACQDALEYEKGNIDLRTNALTISKIEEALELFGTIDYDDDYDYKKAR